MKKGETQLPTHVVIPDTQVKPGVPTAHLDWIGRYIVDRYAGRPNVKIIHLGDHADMPSLSYYDKGKKAMEGRRYVDDIEAANQGFDVLCKPLADYNKRRPPKTQWWPERHITLGNHEDRIDRATEADAQIDGAISLSDLNFADHGWTVHPFLKPVTIDGIVYAHYFANPMTGNPYGGAATGRLKTLGHSFTMGHQQTYDISVRFVNGQQQRGLIAGACYLHDEDYRGYQGNIAHWRGILVCHEVQNGGYNLMEISLEYLCQRYTGKTLKQWLKENT